MSMNQTIAALSQAQGHVFISISDWPTLPRYRPQMERPLRTMVSSKVLGQLQDSQHVASSLISQRVVALPCLLVNSASSDLQRARRMPLVPQATAVPAGFSGHVFLTASGIRAYTAERCRSDGDDDHDAACCLEWLFRVSDWP